MESILFFCLFVLFCFSSLFRATPAAHGSPQAGVELELQLPTYTTATPALHCICDLHHSSRQRRILNPLREARARTRILMDASRIPFHRATMGTPIYALNKVSEAKSVSICVCLCKPTCVCMCWVYVCVGTCMVAYVSVCYKCT